MPTIPHTLLDTFISDGPDHGLDGAASIVERRLADLNHEQLVALLPYVHIDYGNNDRIEDEELRRVMGEATWRDFIEGWLAVTGTDLFDISK